jgi:hypothetical protein
MDMRQYLLTDMRAGATIIRNAEVARIPRAVVVGEPEGWEPWAVCGGCATACRASRAPNRPPATSSEADATTARHRAIEADEPPSHRSAENVPHVSSYKIFLPVRSGSSSRSRHQTWSSRSGGSGRGSARVRILPQIQLSIE